MSVSSNPPSLPPDGLLDDPYENPIIHVEESNPFKEAMHFKKHELSDPFNVLTSKKPPCVPPRALKEKGKVVAENPIRLCHKIIHYEKHQPITNQSMAAVNISDSF